ncbi:hypothetical protein [Marinitoga sp. 1197]|uniref:hypothetical protein n=1 Tax=Marinitoga sp. 1197 TaxID=1428449 RepID=UPI0012E0BB27|nr:hypothetical protein [Marinitoga sp. 1197]
MEFLNYPNSGYQTDFCDKDQNCSSCHNSGCDQNQGCNPSCEPDYACPPINPYCIPIG